MTQYAALIYTKDVDWSLPEYADVSEEYGKFGENNAASIRGGEVVTTDGPYAETKEALTGFYLVEADDLDAAVAIAAQIPAAWDGAVELRPVNSMGSDNG